MKNVIVGFLLGIAIFVGLGSVVAVNNEPQEIYRSGFAYIKKYRDGDVLCYLYQNGYGAGISCLRDKAK